MARHNLANVWWPVSWEKSRLTNGLWLVEGHTITRTDKKWYLLCPVVDDLKSQHHLGYAGSTLQDAVYTLEDHLREDHL